LPEAIRTWPYLQPDPVLASIATPLLVRQQELGRTTVEDEVDSHLNTLLVAADDMGYLHYYLDGSYPLGAVLVRHGTSVTCLGKDVIEPKFYGHLREQPDETKTTSASPVVIDLPLLQTRQPRDVALLSTSARELLWYAMRTVREMRTAWFGSEAQTGARELGPRWLRALETTQREQFGGLSLCFFLSLCLSC
jgi:anaphase-promoting complex subunit 4